MQKRRVRIECNRYPELGIRAVLELREYLLYHVDIASKTHPKTEQKEYKAESDPGVLIFVLEYNLRESNLRSRAL